MPTWIKNLYNRIATLWSKDKLNEYDKLLQQIKYLMELLRQISEIVDDEQVGDTLSTMAECIYIKPDKRQHGYSMEQYRELLREVATHMNEAASIYREILTIKEDDVRL